jgi:hypothetical protein
MSLGTSASTRVVIFFIVIRSATPSIAITIAFAFRLAVTKCETKWRYWYDVDKCRRWTRGVESERTTSRQCGYTSHFCETYWSRGTARCWSRQCQSE